ncbi:MAG: MEDS domain-containing protein [Candidatus Limnocylindria bacterium]
MRSSRRTVRLAGHELREHRHVVALVEGPRDADELLTPFIVDGLRRGDRVVSAIDPELRGQHIGRLEAAGIDVTAATASGQLDVQTWNDTYMRGGRFDRAATLESVRTTLQEGRDLGFPMTRLIGSADWARDAPTLRDLLHYERRLDAMLRRLPDVTVCTYDLNRHSARTVAQVLAIHPVALVGGVLQTTPGAAHAAPRDRLLAAAAQLFHESGIQATGVDSLIEAAGVAKATFYRHFPSKEDLVVAWLKDERTNWFNDVRAVAEDRAASPVEVIPLVFEVAAEWFAAEGYRGCPYLNAAVEITDPDHPALRVVRGFLDRLQGQLVSLAAAAGMPAPEAAGRRLQILLAGALSQSVARHSAEPFGFAREAAIRLVESAGQAEAGDSGA